MQFLYLTSGRRVAVFAAGNDWFWPNFTVRTKLSVWSFPDIELAADSRHSRIPLRCNYLCLATVCFL
jgi:hypothetical protein